MSSMFQHSIFIDWLYSIFCNHRIPNTSKYYQIIRYMCILYNIYLILKYSDSWNDPYRWRSVLPTSQLRSRPGFKWNVPIRSCQRKAKRRGCLEWTWHKVTYPLVNIKNNYWKWPWIVELPWNMVIFPKQTVSLPEGQHHESWSSWNICSVSNRPIFSKGWICHY